MTLEQLLKDSAGRLIAAGYVHGQRDTEIFLAELLGIDTGALPSLYEESVNQQLVHKLTERVERRLKGEPVAYIVGNQQFMGWKFLSDNRALIPRPETEQLTELLIREIQKHQLASGGFLEVGTGTGIVAIALKKYFPHGRVLATDISHDALELAEDNANRLNVEVEFVQGNLFEPVGKQTFDLIAANLPYVPTQKLAFVSDQILDFEPMVAIEAGEDGLLYIEPFLTQIGQYLNKNGIAGIEMWHTHDPAVRELAAKYLPNHHLIIEKDLAGFDRFALFLPN